jgi:simple sugar transport system permease protein
MDISVFIATVLKSSLAMTPPLLFPSLGEAISERAGVYNVGIEGYMLAGAIFGYYGAYISNSMLLGLIIGMAGGALLSLIHAFLSIHIKANQIISGIGIWLFAMGITAFLYRTLNIREPVKGFSDVHLRVLSDLPLVGPVLFQQNVLVYLGFLLVLLFYVLFHFTSFGLLVRATGDNPLAVDLAGHNVSLIRYLCVLICGAMSGLGGLYLSLAILRQFSENMTAGVGFIALCIVIFGDWNPPRILWGAILFAAVNAIQLRIQASGMDIPYPLLLMSPYIITLIILVGFIGKVNEPKKLLVPYVKGEE